MPKIAYIGKNFRSATLAIIDTANDIIVEYEAQGFDLTLRQLYYQMVARGHIENSQRSYKNFGSVVDDGRLAGLIDWNRIVDRTRNVRSVGHFDNPADIMRAAVNSYYIDKWKDQPYRVEVWIEKDALIGVIEGVCRTLDVPYFACRGYTSQSEMWSAAQRLIDRYENGQVSVILHLGDHDPSGIDMTRDITDRLTMFCDLDSVPVDVRRLALNWDQVQQYNPPPNPTKMEDSRAESYVTSYGMSSWELDALEPSVIVGLIERNVRSFRDEDTWADSVADETNSRDLLRRASANWGDIAKMLEVKRPRGTKNDATED